MDYFFGSVKAQTVKKSVLVLVSHSVLCSSYGLDLLTCFIFGLTFKDLSGWKHLSPQLKQK